MPPPQLALWPELSDLPGHFVLYGGTAIALRLGGRQSVDFDFFTSTPIDAGTLQSSLDWLRGTMLVQAAPNTATFVVERGGPVKVSFFGGLDFGRVGDPGKAVGHGLKVASLLDLAAQKVKVVQVRAERKDYHDIDRLLSSGITLSEMLGAARALYPQFAPVPTLKALSYFGDGDLALLSDDIRARLARAAQAVDVVPFLARRADTLE
ncbi:MAG: nucleotidyl transferase AbiEii/AbiGii toxin family protein [Prosthecobacter sp.]|nr:nucleotidyl transferase AbiEii/AbiGii toxin family protein [Prosthecobacter sp.]